MTDTTQTVTTAQFDDQARSQGDGADAVDALVREFSQEAGKRVGAALAEEIHNDPEARRAAATGAGVGLGVVVGIGLLALLTQ
ncbi:hypothetical protein SAMN05216388_10675 [Halorientalis persicus]|uniref:Uncharacterized protein n=1 Tax=Halorientalis persicus TaxID=1367881 RepID=A0A1H8WN93_9EURY|nr:hypothetical protein SAMN05216388_10675 [Halorientalis persicus]